MKKNQEIRQSIKEAGLKLWQIGEELGLNDGNFSRLMRKELSELQIEFHGFKNEMIEQLFDIQERTNEVMNKFCSKLEKFTSNQT